MEIFDGRYIQEQLLGRGAFSEVWKVKDQQTGVTLALKIYNPTTGIDEDGNEMLTHEFALMVNANQKNLLHPLFFDSCGNRPYLILPFCEKGNIGKMIGKMSEDEAWKLLRDCASALAYLHEMNPPILHQDIKPANILLNDNGDYMLTDFGVSTQVKQSLSRVSHEDQALLSAGTISYMAPERFSRNNLPVMANDIYSLGSTVFEMVSGELPFGVDGGLLQKKGAEIPELPGNYSPLLKKTLDDCLKEEPWNRPTASKLEEIANKALQDPNSRYEIEETASQPIETDVPTDVAKKTVIGASNISMANSPKRNPDQKTKGTVIGSANLKVKGTVMGSAGHHHHNESQSESTILEDNYTAPQKSKSPMIISILAVIAVLAGVGFYLYNGQSAEDSEQVVNNTEVSQESLEEKEYKEVMALLQQNNPDSVKVAFNKMKVLADNGYPEAIFQVAYTYAWIPKDGESVRRKTLLGWKLDNIGLPDATEINQEAINALTKSIEVTDSADYKSMYWLASYYIIGQNVSRDMNKALSLLRKAQEIAAIKQDIDFKQKIDNSLEKLTQE